MPHLDRTPYLRKERTIAASHCWQRAAPSGCNQNEAIDHPDMMSYVVQDIGGGVPGSHHSMRATDYFLKYMFQEGGQRIGRPPHTGTRLRAEPGQSIATTRNFDARRSMSGAFRRAWKWNSRLADETRGPSPPSSSPNTTL